MEEKKTIPVIIKVKTEVYQQNNFREFHLEEEGQIIRVGEILYIRYKETIEGVANKVSVTVKILPDGSVQLIRAGDIRMKLKFDYQQYNETHYQTNFGTMWIKTFTNNIRVSLRDRPYSGEIKVDYELYGEQEKLGVYHLQLNFTA